MRRGLAHLRLSILSVALLFQKKDPAQFLQVHGRACKVHLDSAVALAAESPVNM